jgi:hypothetical protein
MSSGGVAATLWAVIEEIDDDDEDILEVTIDVVNDSSRDLWDINGDIRAMDGTHAHPRGAPSRIESGDSGELVFWVPADTGAWLFKIDYNTDSGRGSVELGPFTNDMRIKAESKPEHVPKKEKSIGSVKSNSLDPMASAFGTALQGFGDEVESHPIVEIDVTSDDPMQAAFAGGIIESQQAPPTPETMTAVPSTPPSSPPGPPSSPPGPPSSPPGPPSSPPGPPSSPPGPPSSPPGPPPSGSPPGPPPKSAKPPGPPPS